PRRILMPRWAALESRGRLNESCRISSQARLLQDTGRARRNSQGQEVTAAVRRPEACRAAPALRFPAGVQRRAQEWGLPERTEPRSRGKAARCASRGSPARICRFRGCDSRGRIWSGYGTDLGSRHLGAGAGSHQSLRTWFARVRAERRTASRGLGSCAQGGRRNPNYWLLIKERDAEAHPGSGDAVVTQNQTSIATGRDIGMVEAARDH